MGWITPYAQTPLAYHGSCPQNQPRDNKTHIACSCALPLPTSQPHASLRRRRGRGGRQAPMICLEGGHEQAFMSPAASP